MGEGLSWFFQEFDPELIRSIAQNVHGGVLPGYPELGRLNPLYVVRNSHISEDINVLMAHHERRLEFLLTEAAHHGDKSDLSDAVELARRHGIDGRRLPIDYSEYPKDESDSFVSTAGESSLREQLREDLDLYRVMVKAQEQRRSPPGGGAPG